MNIKIANRFIKLRKEKGLSQDELANQLGISRQAISKWERAEASPDTENLISLAQLYNISLDDLLNSEESLEDLGKKNKAQKNEDCADKNPIVLTDKNEIYRKPRIVKTLHAIRCSLLLVMCIFTLIIPFFTLFGEVYSYFIGSEYHSIGFIIRGYALVYDLGSLSSTTEICAAILCILIPVTALGGIIYTIYLLRIKIPRKKEKIMMHSLIIIQFAYAVAYMVFGLSLYIQSENGSGTLTKGVFIPFIISMVIFLAFYLISFIVKRHYEENQ